MPRTAGAPHRDIDVDLTQIKRSLMKIESPQMRYWIAQFVDLIAEGLIAADRRAMSALDNVGTVRRGKPRARRAKIPKPLLLSNFRPHTSERPAAH
jgi:hypothetical protein